MDHQTIEKAIIKSQHCQRNWDLSKDIPEDDLNTILFAATQCPSKQNVAFYTVHAVMDRTKIEAIHNHTDGFIVRYATNESTTNSQTLANLLIVFEEKPNLTFNDKKDVLRNAQTLAHYNKEVTNDKSLVRDKNMAVGVAAGYVNLTSALLGYATGCCACFDPNGIKDVLQLTNNPILLMGIGYKDANLNRRVHHSNHNFIFPTKSKQTISVIYH